jgi:hypothetical protein
MRLSADELQMAVDSLRVQPLGPGVKFRGLPAPINPAPRTPLAPRARIRPVGAGPRRRAWSVAMRTVTATGVVFVDGNCWLDGESVILQLPSKSGIPAMLCRITHWQPLASDLFVVSASFVRPLEAESRLQVRRAAGQRNSQRT